MESARDLSHRVDPSSMPANPGSGDVEAALAVSSNLPCAIFASHSAVRFRPPNGKKCTPRSRVCGCCCRYCASPTTTSSGADTVTSFVRLVACFETAASDGPAPQSMAYLSSVFSVARPGRPTLNGRWLIVAVGGFPLDDRRGQEHELRDDLDVGAGLVRVRVLADDGVAQDGIADVLVAFRMAGDADLPDPVLFDEPALEDLQRALELADRLRDVARHDQHACERRLRRRSGRGSRRETPRSPSAARRCGGPAPCLLCAASPRARPSRAARCPGTCGI